MTGVDVTVANSIFQHSAHGIYVNHSAILSIQYHYISMVYFLIICRRAQFCIQPQYNWYRNTRPSFQLVSFRSFMYFIF